MPKQFSLFSMHAGEAMTLLMLHVDIDTIWLVGRWWSDEMLLYIHTSAQGFTSGLTEIIFQHRNYPLISPIHGV